MEEGEEALVQLCSEEGKVLYESKQHAIEELLDMRHYSAGIYYLKVFMRKEAVSYKLLKL